MIHLSDKKCVACEGGTPPLTSAEIQKYLPELSKEWQVINENPSTGLPRYNSGQVGARIKREFKFKDFKEALAFTNKIGEIAESEGHHPDLELGWGRVVVELSTHAVGGLSENDFILAAKIDKI